jgi:Carboxypeptidase regulatory-like domain
VTKVFRSLALPFLLVSVAAVGCECDEELLVYPGQLTGIVCSADSGVGLANARVVVTDEDGKTYEALTGDDGTYTFEKIPPGKATVSIESPDGTREQEVLVQSREEITLSDEFCQPPPPPLDPAGTIVGCVCDDSRGVWVAGGNAYVLTPEGGIYAATTDEDGCFSLLVPPGTHEVTIEKGAFVASHQVTVVDDETTSIPTPPDCQPPPPAGDVGAIEGRVCGPDGFSWLADADAYVIVDAVSGAAVSDVTDVEGRYRVENVPVGEQVLHIEKGSFHSQRTVTVVANQTTTIPEEECALEAPDLQIAVVQGDYDHVEDVLGSLGVEAEDMDLYDGRYFGGDDQWVARLIEDYELLSSYDVVFFNCGVNDEEFTGFSDPSVAIANLRQFVQEGGSVYASDWAYDIIEKTWPEAIDFEGTDSLGNNAQKGIDQAPVVGTITDPSLAAAMGQATINMDYLLGQWAVMTAVNGSDPGITVYVRGPARVCSDLFCSSEQDRTNIPHTVGFSFGAGKVLYTSFHQEPGINFDQERILQLLMFEL